MDVETYREAWARRWAEEAARDEALAREARTLLPELTRLLVEDFGATAVVLIGSLARGDFGARSDIDLVAAGIPPARFFAAGAALDRAAGRQVDLVPWESATEAMREVVRAEGEVLHGAL